MAYLAGPRAGTWEVRESHVTARGPRSRTLATFKVLTPQVLELASRRSQGSVDAAVLRREAIRRGAPAARPAADRAAAELLAELAAGRRPRAVLAQLLRDALPRATRRPPDGARAVAGWVAATLEQRGQALRDLLLLADRLPAGSRGAQSRFPRVNSAPGPSAARRAAP